MVGYDKVVDMANRAGMNYKIQPTPAVALGAYEITPMEAVGAYTIFANQGDYIKPNFISLVRSQDGKVVYRNQPEHKQVLDPRVAYLMTNLMEEVLRSGTAAGVRARGFTVPAAGKTGTSHDGWFAGYTSELLCVVWVGFDDNKELDLQGAHSAAPIWTEFMKRALEYREYRDAKPFQAPGWHCFHRYRSAIRNARHALLPGQAAGGLHRGHAAGGRLPAARRRPARRDQCRRMGNTARPPSRLRRADDSPRATGSEGEVSEAAVARRAARQNRANAAATAQAQPPRSSPRRKRRRGFFRRLLGVFK